MTGTASALYSGETVVFTFVKDADTRLFALTFGLTRGRRNYEIAGAPIGMFRVVSCRMTSRRSAEIVPAVTAG